MLEPQIPAFSGNEHVALAPACRITGIAAFKNTRATLEEVLGVALPAAQQKKTAAGIVVLWSGPDSWLVLGDDPEMNARIAEAGGKHLAAVTDQADGRAIFHVTGPRARDILAKLVPIDLHAMSFSPDATALTLAGHINVQIWREGDAFALACFRSFAESLGHALVAASHEFLAG